MIILIYVDLLDKSFEKYNYIYPQPLIKIFGTNILNWILNYINIHVYSKIIIIYNNEYYRCDITHTLESIYKNIEFIFIYKNLEKSIYDIIDNLNIDDEYLLINTKYFFLKDLISLTNNKNTIFLIKENTFSPKENTFSPKENTFSLKKNSKKNIECDSFNILYVKDKVNNIIDNIYNFERVILNEDVYISLESAFHIRLFCNNFPKIHALNNTLMITKKTFSFDYDDIINGYSISIIQYLYKMGNNIIIETNQAIENKSKIDIFLKEKNIMYHHIIFDKIEYDFHISTKSIKYNYNLEKELGFFYNKVEPRDYNDIIQTNIKTYRKVSNDLSGEIYYYLNIPEQIKDIFPIMFNYDNNENKFYEMENINGIPVSKLYLSEELTIEQFDNILGTIKRIHSIKSISESTSTSESISSSTNLIYSNYANKLKNRYTENIFLYNIFENSDTLYNNLYKELIAYENNNNGIASMIHGDTVFTNIIINNLGKIKLIDMRGKLGDVLSIYGDQLYDWAKIYQSIIGYDEILENKYVSSKYKSTFIDYFLNEFKKIYPNPIYIYFLNIITASLIFTLIPLHNNDKFIKYYELINNLDLNKDILTNDL